VRDQGPGLPAASSERIFEPFVTTKTDGLGIGHSIVVAHGGTIEARNHIDGGAKFVVQLPSERPAP